MKTILLLTLAALLQAAEPARSPLPLTHPLRDKNLYLLSLFEQSTAASQAIAGLALHHASDYRWSDQDIAASAQALGALYKSSSAIRELTDGPLRQSGMYIQSHNLAGPDFLAAAWSQCAQSMNRMIDVYVNGTPPRYAEIDAMLYDPKSAAYQRIIQTLGQVVEDQRTPADLFFSAPMHFALEALILNNRDEAARYEPLDKQENSLSYAVAQITDWSKYPYSVIVVPGAGGDGTGVALSAFGKLRNEIAARRWKLGKAPFIIVSGGHVHPARTQYAEAIEMKRDLMARFAIPENAIIVDPHARHTTTNMRNAARLMYRYGIPFDKKALTVTDAGQSTYIESPTFAKRCTDELGYLPYKLFARISPFDLEFRPTIESLQSDPREPLDP